MIEPEDQCRRCETGRLRGWSELNDEEREVALRLPASKDYSLEDRSARHRWCTRCWYEDKAGEPRQI